MRLESRCQKTTRIEERVKRTPRASDVTIDPPINRVNSSTLAVSEGGTTVAAAALSN